MTESFLEDSSTEVHTYSSMYMHSTVVQIDLEPKMSAQFNQTILTKDQTKQPKTLVESTWSAGSCL